LKKLVMTAQLIQAIPECSPFHDLMRARRLAGLERFAAKIC